MLPEPTQTESLSNTSRSGLPIPGTPCVGSHLEDPRTEHLIRLKEAGSGSIGTKGTGDEPPSRDQHADIQPLLSRNFFLLNICH